MQPALYVVAGPPGSGKSSTFPVNRFGVDSFNADDRAAQLWGSHRRIPVSLRTQVNAELERLVSEHIQVGRSFAFETTLRSPVFFSQANTARDSGFSVHMVYLNLLNVDLNIERVRLRAEKGGHSAPPNLIREIYEASLKNLPRAIRETDSIAVIDNSIPGRQTLLVDAVAGRVQYLTPDAPEWLDTALWGTEFELSRLREELDLSPPQ